MFGSSKRKHAVDNNGKITNGKEKKSVDYYLKPKKKKYKPFLIFFGLVILAVLVWMGANAYSAYSKIVTKNDSSAPFFDFLDKATPDQLKGEGDGRINILLLGAGGENHPGGTLTDTIQVVSIDPNNKKIAALSIPRDLYVEVPNYGGVKINQVYQIGAEDEETYGSGAEIIKNTISEILDLPIHYYIKMDFDGFKKIIDEVGGVDINVETTISDPYYPAEDMIGYNPFYIEAGQQQMNGTVALKYARSRETTSDFDRSARQQQILIALRDKVLNLGFLTNPTKLVSMMQILGDHLRTDLGADEMKRLAEIVKDVDTGSMVSKVLDTSDDGPLTGFSNGGYYIQPKTGNWKEVQRIAHEIFSDPYLANENARLEVLNGTSQVGMGKEVSDTLTSYGYNVVNLDTADENYPRTILYDYSNGQYPYTVKFLSDRYNVQVKEQPSTSQSKVDMELIVGEDYLNDANN